MILVVLSPVKMWYNCLRSKSMNQCLTASELQRLSGCKSHVISSTTNPLDRENLSFRILRQPDRKPKGVYSGYTLFSHIFAYKREASFRLGNPAQKFPVSEILTISFYASGTGMWGIPVQRGREARFRSRYREKKFLRKNGNAD